MFSHSTSYPSPVRHLKVPVITSAIAAVIATGSQAQDNHSVKQLLEETEVVGIRANLESAQALKKAANTVKDIVTSADINALPDKSVTEALMRIPGVTIERFAASDDPNHFAAEGTGVVVRGLKRVRSEMNGRDSFSARRDGSGLNFENIPPELLGRVEVVKNTTADLIAGGVAGTVNLVTRKPFDNDELQVFASAKGSYGDHIDEWSPAYSGLFSNTFDTSAGKFGFLISASDSEYSDRGDGVSLDNYYERSASASEMPQFGPWGTALTDYPNSTLYAPAGVSIRTSDSERKRAGLSTSIQWLSPSETTEATLEYISSKAELSWDERVVQYGEQGFNVNPNNITIANASFDNRGFMQRGEVSPNISLAQSRSRETQSDIEDLSFHLTVQATDALTLDFDMQRIDAEYSGTDYTLSNRFSNTRSYFSLDGDRPNVTYLGENLTSPLTENEMYINSAMDKEDDTDAESTAFAIDAEYEFDNSWITSVQTGLYSSNKKQTIRDSAWNWGEVTCSWQDYGAGAGCRASNTLDHPELFESVTFSKSSFHGGGVLHSDNSFLFPRMDNLHNWQSYHASTQVFDSDGNSIDNGFSTFTALRERDCVTVDNVECVLNDAFLPSEISKSEEDRQEIYLQFNYAFNDLALPIKGNLGLRYINWQVESTGAAQFPVPIPGWDSVRQSYYTQDQLDYQNAVNTNASTIKGDKYSKLLPSFNLSISLSDEQILRLAISENVFFPEFSDFRNFQTITESHQELRDDNLNLTGYENIAFDGETGNPAIEPEEATNIDLTYEWYFNDVGALSLSLFHKKLDNIIRERLYVADVTNPNNDITFPVNFENKTNTGSGTLQGFEIAYQQFYDFLPGALNGLGVQFNYTYLEQDGINDDVGFGDGVAGAGSRNNFRAFTGLDLPGYSDDTVNMALMYEKYDISARLAYNWRSEYLLTRRDSDLFAPVIAESTGTLDASISYNINEHFKVGVDASNLLNEIISTEMIYNQAGDKTPRSYFKTDTRYGVFAQMKF